LIGRIVQSADFKCVLETRSCASSEHFSVHFFLPAQAVLDSVAQESWFSLGVVVPKRHAKRSVTRSLLKRQIRLAMLAQASNNQPLLNTRGGLWVVRLRAPFALQKFPSAASNCLRNAVSGELHELLERAIQHLEK
jgi:ribonuclease P protein component